MGGCAPRSRGSAAGARSLPSSAHVAKHPQGRGASPAASEPEAAGAGLSDEEVTARVRARFSGALERCSGSSTTSGAAPAAPAP